MIKVENLSKTFSPGNIQAVKNISFELGSGEIGCLIGTSGCGKTTTLKMINRLVEPTEGKIWINDRQHQSTDAIQWRRHIGYVIQKAGLLPHLTVFQNISLLSKILKKSETDISNRVKELMGVINMPYEQFKDRYPVELSGGQQQRIGIARALMEDPPILLMDEPFGALDPLTRQSLHNELTLLNKKLKKTILIVTHDIREAFKLGAQIFLMHQGEIIQKGVQNNFLNSPANQFVEDFVKGQLA